MRPPRRLPLALALTALALTAFAAAPARGQSVTVGTAGQSNCIPFGCAFAVTRYQQVYAAGALGGPAAITSVAFQTVFPTNPAISAATYALRLGYTQAPVNGLNGALAANVAGPLTAFATLSLPVGPAPSTLTFVGAAPFAYDPALGNLLLDLLIDDPQGGYASFAADDSGVATSRAYQEGDYSGADAVGLVTTFGLAPAPVTTAPEPGTWALLGTGLLALGAVARRRVNAATAP
jgi:hypothetical protein